MRTQRAIGHEMVAGRVVKADPVRLIALVDWCNAIPRAYTNPTPGYQNLPHDHFGTYHPVLFR